MANLKQFASRVSPYRHIVPMSFVSEVVDQSYRDADLTRTYVFETTWIKLEDRLRVRLSQWMSSLTDSAEVFCQWPCMISHLLCTGNESFVLHSFWDIFKHALSGGTLCNIALFSKETVVSVIPGYYSYFYLFHSAYSSSVAHSMMGHVN
jgi:hypothetical protein